MTAPGWALFSYLVANEFGALAARRIELQLQREELEGLNLEIGAMLDTIEQKTVRVEYKGQLWNITRTGGGGESSRISEDLLIEHGVHPIIIKRSKVPTNPRSPSITLSRVREEEQLEPYTDFVDE